MVECEVVKKNPALKVRRQKEDVKIDGFTDEQIKQMLNFYRRIRRREKQYFAYRDYIMIVLILGTGIRRGELINLLIPIFEDIQLRKVVVGEEVIKLYRN
ncbi:site-specific integrase [Peribacillus butanolivorans]|uniref:hypothetical protein n=1 Tax=Peribacillus butanolivorans TaxID=421767 RepID=UPI00128F13AB|nr:hypothetical protein [Peribacillus butanolivorans]